MNSSKFFFMTFMIVGVMMCYSSNNWILIWCGLEITLISFLPMMLSKLILSSESMMKYFLIQSASSSILIMGLMMMMFDMQMNNFIVTMALMLKTGIAPLHNWVLSMIEGMNYNSMMILMVLLKLPPLIILSYLNSSMVMIVMTSLLLGSTLGLNQNSTRKLIVYSSIFNLGMIISAMNFNLTWMSFFVIYSSLLTSLISIMKKLSINYINQITFNENSMMYNMTMWFILLSMGGMPPMMGFSAKLIIIQNMIFQELYLITFVMIMSSLMVMFFYNRMMFISISMFSLKNKYSNYSNLNSSMVMTIINLMILPMTLMLKSF
uniref:NADH-ubiquinone oxidoreductase chain 2 n=1 Tax=Uzeldikra longiprocessa TaxID=2893152 RepID=A0A9E6XQ03_9HEMI|nr:NADH dehydrogenase subunit 2 [Uzeldikra longiprocessa]UGN61290.1 NADH dehydrogenase subunit 2 [Uzeldikra longiprocessa]